MTDLERLSAKIDELTETFKSQSGQLATENQWLSGLIIFIASFGITSILIKIIT